MIIDLKFDGKYVVIVGGGSESYRKTLSFLDAGSKVLVVSKTFSSGIKKLHQMKRIDLLKADIKDGRSFINNLSPKPDVLVVATNDRNLNVQLAKHAKEAGCMVYAVDDPSISDFIFPALAKIGEVRIAISTNGKSPAMARVLRQRIEKMITQEDLLQIKLQNYVRAILKQRILDQKVRRKAIYKILKDDHIKRLLKDGRFNEAQGVAMKILEYFEVNDESYKGLSAITN
ncbi:MAG: bifunctional precorrin-2 dehydrogenase/sirohydrochlorin ferrochelatase [archaeon]|nr:bifunctional precorrin-2 dehydrogenase/sirohydrochlorin ferrochelatase [archaeon]MCP8313388.1 bifunctional precorrin-2 dehydrogenase/sirohydrochlorin ferrochelatase [archaeon]MCP8316446.1 bifunctional precorrin-2 dehydrogenase/sirohydrochlorin ferrochelatase [archaeon]MCP8322547.1 bifunctional precorrin-2 dehydrogenase/sirohydrochlorin ferrochelatase [archaeon]